MDTCVFIGTRNVRSSNKCLHFAVCMPFLHISGSQLSEEK